MPAVLLYACTSGHQGPVLDEWRDVPNSHARCFTIQSRGQQKRILVFGPGGRTDTLSTIPVPAKAHARIATLSTTHVPYLMALGLGERVVGVAHRGAIREPFIANGLAKGLITDLVSGERLDREALMGLQPDLLFDQPFGRSDLMPRVEGPLQIMVTEYLEEHALGRAEWIRAFGAIMGREAQADSIYTSIETRYEVALQLLEGVRDRPTAFYGSAWDGRFHGASGKSYMAQLIRDAGGTYWMEGDGTPESVPLGLEAFLALADTLDHIGMAVSLDHPPDALDLVGGERRLIPAQSIAHGGFYGNSGTSDLFGRALLEPDVVLLDLIKVLHPERAQDHTPRYFHRIVQ